MGRDNDPLLQPYQLNHLRLKNRVMTTAHEPAYSEDGLPKDRYRLYHVERAKGGVALTMTAGCSIVSPDSPAAFGNLHAYRDEIVPWLQRLADDCHEHGAAVMIQISHLGRRTNWNKADWLAVLAPSPNREPVHRTFPKAAEDWDMERIVADYAGAAQRMQAAGVHGIVLEAHGHPMDGLWSPATNRRYHEHGGTRDNRLRFTHRALDAMRAACGKEFIVGIRKAADEDWSRGLSRTERLDYVAHGLPTQRAAPPAAAGWRKPVAISIRQRKRLRQPSAAPPRAPCPWAAAAARSVWVSCLEKLSGSRTVFTTVRNADSPGTNPPPVRHAGFIASAVVSILLLVVYGRILGGFGPGRSSGA